MLLKSTANGTSTENTEKGFKTLIHIHRSSQRGLFVKEKFTTNRWFFDTTSLQYYIETLKYYIETLTPQERCRDSFEILEITVPNNAIQEIAEMLNSASVQNYLPEDGKIVLKFLHDNSNRFVIDNASLDPYNPQITDLKVRKYPK